MLSAKRRSGWVTRVRSSASRHTSSTTNSAPVTPMVIATCLSTDALKSAVGMDASMTQICPSGISQAR